MGFLVIGMVAPVIHRYDRDPIVARKGAAPTSVRRLPREGLAQLLGVVSPDDLFCGAGV